MTIDEARAAVEAIRAMASDEAAHIAEDDLRDSVLEAIASGKAEDPAALARVALETSTIEFARWYA